MKRIAGVSMVTAMLVAVSATGNAHAMNIVGTWMNSSVEVILLAEDGTYQYRGEVGTYDWDGKALKLSTGKVWLVDVKSENTIEIEKAKGVVYPFERVQAVAAKFRPGQYISSKNKTLFSFYPDGRWESSYSAYPNYGTYRAHVDGTFVIDDRDWKSGSWEDGRPLLNGKYRYEGKRLVINADNGSQIVMSTLARFN